MSARCRFGIGNNYLYFRIHFQPVPLIAQFELHQINYVWLARNAR